VSGIRAMSGCSDLLSLVIIPSGSQRRFQGKDGVERHRARRALSYQGDERQPYHAQVVDASTIVLSFVTILCHLRLSESEDASRTEGLR
jgi:hypothetical protein